MKKFQVFILVLLAISIVVATNAYAKDDNPCKKDIAKFCKNIEPGEGRILKCLTLSEENLAPACRKRLNRIKTAVEEVQQVCADDYAIFCSSVLPGQGRAVACLEKNKKTLTPKCRAGLDDIVQKHREIQEQMKKK